ncbi:hypothetical protein KQX54_019874 [Cotesia glomerata]|uniref:Uncharacterized protein n=1 Tax=Cotesia glomerata TaxID=32391 RepID=A0AAV7I174_COTGL|nr:hypothetical protein KQX54_019874 [Cotesia glomerata]
MPPMAERQRFGSSREFTSTNSFPRSSELGIVLYLLDVHHHHHHLHLPRKTLEWHAQEIERTSSRFYCITEQPLKEEREEEVHPALYLLLPLHFKFCSPQVTCGLAKTLGDNRSIINSYESTHYTSTANRSGMSLVQVLILGIYFALEIWNTKLDFAH